jgi:PhnB protein
MTKSWKPAGHTSVSPYLVTTDARAVIGFLRATLGAALLEAYERPDGSIMHAELRIDDTILMLGEVEAGSPPVPCHLHVYVPDVDRTYRTALENGAKPVQEPVRREGESDRRGGVTGPGGNTWWFATRVEP